MKTATRDWVRKAEHDYLAAVDLARRRKQPVYDAVCFHAQQSAEKYLKARMEEAGMSIPRTHDLEDLLNQLLSIEPRWATFRAASQTLSDFAVDFRYPGQSATKAQALQALADCKSLRREVRSKLGLRV
ncbi:MAG TPA: HEPN domain-containing protein [Candidatus Eisenbacteria bacterium]|jgi:HEPN domain-containing protein|nr:HEPN domain-containing protein [Candidatus Eisenbacteria bacterium]